MIRSLALPLAIASAAFGAEVKMYEPTGNTAYLSPEESLDTFVLPEGYSLELVVAEPHVSQPAVVAFDGNGRMYVVEMNTYMLDADGTGEDEPNSRVTWHEDTNGDGKMDKHGVFLDNLLLPRIILPLDDRILIQETYTNDIYSYRDTTGDGTADEKTIWYEGGERGGNMEHQPTGLIWSMDNGLYTTYNGHRLKYNHDGPPIKEPTGYGGQWGLTQDDYGKPWLVSAGSEIGPHHFQTPILYGVYSHQDEYPAGYREVFPLVGLPDVQGGAKRYRPDTKNLNHFTSACGQTVVRGENYPSDLKGNLLFAEPVGRLIRRSPINVDDGVTKLTNFYEKGEFIRSTDPNFRPINMCNGPDGCTYIVDMYRGIIQQAAWTAKGSYLRSQIEAYGLDKNTGKGRIYRLVHKDHKRGAAKPNMLNESPSQWVTHLENPNGWWRDTAQKLLVLKNDHSVVPALEKMARESSFELARLHALWTLEGIKKLTPELASEFIASDNLQLRKAGLRVSESLYQGGNHTFAPIYQNALNDNEPEVTIQGMLTSKRLNVPNHRQWIQETLNNTKSEGVKTIAKQILTGIRDEPPKLPAEELAQYKHGEQIHETLCAACHGKDAKGVKTSAGGKDIYLAPSLVDNDRLKAHPETAIKTLLHGLKGDLDGVKYSGNMISMASHGDAWIADILSYLRLKHNDNAGFVKKEEVSALREKYAGRTDAWTQAELESTASSPLDNKKEWIVTTNQNPETAAFIADGNSNTSYTTKTDMKHGMYVQVELPEVTELTGCSLEYEKSPHHFPRTYKIEYSQDGKTWQNVGQQNGVTHNLLVYHSPVKAKYFKFTQLANHGPPWTFQELQLLQPN